MPIDGIPPPRDDAQEQFLTAQERAYPYANVRVPYRSEALKISESDRERIHAWIEVDEQAGAREPPSRPTTQSRRKIILDTDIGTDIDDALALLMLLELPEDDVELVGLTTVYGYSHVRANVAERIVRAFEHQRGRSNSIPVLAGESTPLGTHRPVWHSGTEGLGILPVEEIERLRRRADFVVANGISIVPLSTPAHEQGRHAAARWIAEQTRQFPGAVTIVSIGQLTNVAVALAADPAMQDNVERVVHMALGDRVPRNELPSDCPGESHTAPIVAGSGSVWHHRPNHNVSGDTLAARIVYGSRAKIDVLPHAVTSQIWWGEVPARAPGRREWTVARDACLALMDARAPGHAAAVGALLRVWLDYRSGIFGAPVRGTCPHDALTVAESIYPGRFLDFTAQGHLVVHEWAGFSSFVCAPGGPHRLATAVRADPFVEFLSKRLHPAASR